MTTKFGVADDFVFGQIDSRRLAFIAHRRQVIATGMTAPEVIPVLRHSKDVIQVLLADHAERIEHLVLQCLNHPLDERLQVGWSRGGFLILQPVDQNTASKASTYFVSRSRCRSSQGGPRPADASGSCELAEWSTCQSDSRHTAKPRCVASRRG